MAEEWFIATYLWYVFCLEIHRGALSLLKIKIVSYLSLVDCVSFLSIGMSKFFVFWFAIPQFLIWFFYIPWYAIFYNPFDQEWRIEKYIEFNSCLHNIFFQSSTHDPNHSKLKRFFYSMLWIFAFSKNTKASLQHFLYGTIIRKNPSLCLFRSSGIV